MGRIRILTQLCIFLILKSRGQIIETDANSKKYIKPLFFITNKHSRIMCMDHNEASGLTVVGGYQENLDGTFTSGSGLWRIGWMGIKTSSNTGAYNDWDSMLSFGTTDSGVESCKFTK